MSRFTVLVTDYAWPDLDIERAVLREVDAELLVAETGEEIELIELAPEADAILTCWKPTTARVLEAAGRCVQVSRYGIGLDNIDVTKATELGMIVTNVPDFCLNEVADHTLALMLACSRRVVIFDAETRGGVWNLKTGKSMSRLRGQTLGLVGFGNTARAVAERARAFGLHVLAYTPRIDAENTAGLAEATRDLDALLERSDFVSLHVPLSKETRGLIAEAELRRMKSSVFLINTSRGAVVDEKSLERALVEGWIAGAALDVLVDEPPSAEHPFLALANAIVTPHAAFYSEEAIADLQRGAARRVAEALAGRIPEDIVNPEVLEFPGLRLKARSLR